MPTYQPPKQPKHIDERCWLCGGDTQGQGWDMKKAMGNAFTDHNIAKASHSRTVCCSCAALTSKQAWVMACEKHGHDPYFPVKEGKKPFLANWMFSSHVFTAKDWLRPDRSGIRELLLNPPEPPFVMTIAEVGKKHVIFRAPVNHSTRVFTVQLDENSIVIDATLFKPLLADFEAAYTLGLSKQSLLTGQYNTAQCMKAGVNVWRDIETVIARYRRQYPGMLRIAGFCGKKN